MAEEGFQNFGFQLFFNRYAVLLLLLSCYKIIKRYASSGIYVAIYIQLFNYSVVFLRVHNLIMKTYS